MQSMFAVLGFEEKFLYLVQATPNALLDYFFQAITLLGHPAFWLMIAALLYWTNRERQSFFLVNTIMLASAVAACLKILVARPRPDPTSFKVSQIDFITKALEANVPNSGFPSGHSTIVAAALTFFSRNKKALQIFGFVIIALLVGFSRLYLGYHFLLDVVAGLLLGLVVGLFVLQLDKFFERHNFHLSKLQDEAIVLLLVGIAVIAIALIEMPALAFSALGYYAGFFLCKEIGFKQEQQKGRKLIAKLLIGTISSAIMLVLTVLLYPINQTLALFFFFTNGFWISFGWPELLDRATKYPIVSSIWKRV